MYKPRGSFSAMTVDAVKRASVLQAETLAAIHQKYETERPSVDPYTISFLDFVAELEEAEATGTLDAVNAKYAALLQPFIQQILMPPQQEQ